MNADRRTRQNNRFKDKTASSGLGYTVSATKSIKTWSLCSEMRERNVRERESDWEVGKWRGELERERYCERRKCQREKEWIGSWGLAGRRR